MRSALLAVFLVATGLVGVSSAETYKVSDLKTLADLVGGKAGPGDIIELAYGTYYLDVPRINVESSGTPDQPLIIRGIMQDGKRPVIDASRVNVKRCVLCARPNSHDVIFENLEICNAWGSRFSDKEKYGVNATAIYFEESNNITVRNCESHNNEDGFFATHNADFILIDGCSIHHNGTLNKEPHNGTHNFYFCARHQMVKNCYIGHANESQNWKSRGGNTIFAFNWVEEEYSYSLGADSDNEQNTLWLGNLVMKRTFEGMGQGRIGGLGDGTGVARGTVVVLNNTFVTVRPRDFHLFTEHSSTGDFYCVNNAFVGPGMLFLDHNGQGKVYGTNNWIAGEALNVPYAMDKTIRNDDIYPKGFNAQKLEFRAEEGSEVVDAGVPSDEYLKAVKMVTQYSRGEGQVIKPSPAWLAALEEIEKPAPAYEPVTQGAGFQPRPYDGHIDLGAYEYVKGASTESTAAATK